MIPLRPPAGLEILHGGEYRDRVTAADLLAVAQVLRDSGIPFWIHGGWAHEMVLGRPLEHGDIDVFIRDEDAPRLIALLGDRVQARAPHHIMVNIDGAVTDITFLKRMRGGRRVVDFGKAIWVMPESEFNGYEGVVDGQRLPMASPAFAFAELTHPLKRKRRVVAKHAERAELLRAALPEAEVARSRRLWPRRGNLLNRVRTALGI